MTNVTPYTPEEIALLKAEVSKDSYRYIPMDPFRVEDSIRHASIRAWKECGERLENQRRHARREAIWAFVITFAMVLGLAAVAAVFVGYWH
jgi:hypothetical protein